MKKIISLILALVIVLSLGVSAFADDVFVSSVNNDFKLISGEIIDENGNVIAADGELEECLVFTHITMTDHAHFSLKDEMRLLIKVYNQLVAGTMKLPYAKYGYNPDTAVIVDLYDGSFLCDEHPVAVAPKGIRVRAVLEANVPEGEEICVMTYKNGQWGEIVSAVNNNDGTITCVFEDFCPIAISIVDNSGNGVKTEEANPNTGAPVFGGVAVLAAAAAVVLGRKK